MKIFQYRNLEVHEITGGFGLYWVEEEPDEPEWYHQYDITFAHIGDKVDMYEMDDATIPVGSPQFYMALAADIIENYDQWVKAYFSSRA